MRKLLCLVEMLAAARSMEPLLSPGVVFQKQLNMVLLLFCVDLILMARIVSRSRYGQRVHGEPGSVEEQLQPCTLNEVDRCDKNLRFEVNPRKDRVRPRMNMERDCEGSGGGNVYREGSN